MWLTETHNDEMFNGLNLSQLAIDEFYVNFTGKENELLFLYTKKKECYECPYSLRFPISGFMDYIKYSSRPAEDWRIKSDNLTMLSYPLDNENVLCSSFDYNFNPGEFGVYTFETNNCNLITEKEPVNIYAGILTVILLSALFTAIGYAITLSYNKILTTRRRNKEVNGPNNTFEIKEEQKKRRVQSLDTFRGISIIVMIFVNYGGGGYDFFEHAAWNGLNVADLVFPWFMWIMGVCIPISIKSATKGDANKGLVFLKIFKRSVVLFMLGVFLNQGKVLKEIRIFGVLQRFGMCYLVVATLQLIFSDVTNKLSSGINSRFIKIIQCFYVLIPQWIVIMIIMTIHLVLTFRLEVPGCPTGYLGPGGLYKGGFDWNCTGGATGYIDRKIVGYEHLYQHSTAKPIYESLAFDPEGLFGTLMSIVQVFIGVQAGSTLLTYKSHKDRLIRWSLWAVFTGIVGGILCNFSKEEGVIPVNKNLWSLSFVLVTSCFAFILLSFCYVIIDIKHFWSGKPFMYAGMNPTIMYVGHSLTYAFPFQWALTPMNTHYLYLAMAIWGTAMWNCIAYGLYKNKFFLSI